MKNLKIRIAKYLLLVFIISLTILTINYISNNLSTITYCIDEHMYFTCPSSISVENIYLNKSLSPENHPVFSNSDNSVHMDFFKFKPGNGEFSFSYPSNFIIIPTGISGKEIVYHIDFLNKSKTSHGFIQVWALDEQMDKFLEKSKSHQINVQDFSSKEVLINSLKGFYWDYKVLGNNNQLFHCLEVFLENNNRMYRISYFTPEKNWDKSQEKLFWQIVQSFQLKS